MEVKNHIKKVRQEKRVSRYALAKQTGLNWHTLYKLEEGGDFKVSSLLAIAKALDVSIIDLVNEKE